jgi:hypothetical protein
LGRGLGFDIDDLRALTPAGSISRLTRAEADALIGRLRGGRGGSGSQWRAQGTTTSRQLGMMAHLCDLIGFTEAGFCEWLSKRFEVQHPSEITDRAVAAKVIAGLVRMQSNVSAGHLAGRGRRRPGGAAAGQGQRALQRRSQ